MPRDLTPDEAARQVRWSDAASRDTLQLIAEGVTQVAGFGIAAISVVRDGALESVAIAGNDQARAELEGTRTTVERVLAELEKADDWGLLRFVPHERLDPGAGDTWGWVPDIQPIDAPDAWDPMDLLIAPLYDDSGALRGTLAMDLPLDGLRPGQAQREVLNTYAEQAGRAVVVALEREALADQVRMAQAARRIVRKATAQLSLERIFADSTEALLEGFRAAGMWIQTFSEEEGQGLILSADGLDVALSPQLRRIAEGAAREAWRDQQVAIVGPGRPWLPPITDAEGGLILEFLAQIGVGSLMFIPLGAGPECLGNLALTRLTDGPAWTEAEAAAALDIGHDLGHAILNARTFEREHELVEELQALDAYKGQLIATVAHELKNPLTSVLGHLEMLDASPDLSGPTRGSLATMERGAQRMVRVIEDLLLLAKVGDANTPLISVPVDLHRILEDVVDLSTMAARHKDISLVVDSPTDPVLALGDPDELDRICGNLVSNAVKYTPEGGTVTVTLSRRADRVELSCADTGIGIAPEDLDRLGTEFFRSSNPEAVAQPGTGLGLAIVQRIVERHGGELVVESELGRGSVFRVTLPAA
ncbi:sensor histidine kinase [Nocardioides mangrovi]|uniref:histidine kinase n=1 Tax=Nocardioides mangrovi TaxID=2874580 RepID=A0ABS7UBK6_9ACTN|nr:HAMP domain-containing sensor histidine kinase [Nocardioides mangrovi]MBZ5738361.1 HAMP domain-containing histidine kinase [Nocardioides mangrovi]